MRERAPAAAVLLRDGHAEQAELPGVFPEITIDVMLLDELLDVRLDLLLAETAGEITHSGQVVVFPG